MQATQRIETLDPQLAEFTGTTNYYKYPLNFSKTPLRYTDGVQYLAQQFQAYWLLDVVFSHVQAIYMDKTIESDDKDFLNCVLQVHDNNSCTFTIDDGNDKPLARQEIEYTDFPAKQQKIWVVGGVAMLPSEY